MSAPLRLSWQQVYQQFGADPAKASDNNTVQNFRRKALRGALTHRSSPSSVSLFNAEGFGKQN